jgi:hypothetical protein
MDEVEKQAFDEMLDSFRYLFGRLIEEGKVDGLAYIIFGLNVIMAETGERCKRLSKNVVKEGIILH